MIIDFEIDSFRALTNNQLIKELNIQKENFHHEDFETVIGSMTPGKKRMVLAAIELYKRRNKHIAEPIKTSSDIWKIMFPIIGEIQHEEIWAIYIDHGSKPLRVFRFGSGGFTGVVADVRILFREAIKCNSTRLIIAHNHPSGNIAPSNLDHQFTNRVKEAGILLEIPLLDHVIIAGEKYYSYSDEGNI